MLPFLPMMMPWIPYVMCSVRIHQALWATICWSRPVSRYSSRRSVRGTRPHLKGMRWSALPAGFLPNRMRAAEVYRRKDLDC